MNGLTRDGAKLLTLLMGALSGVAQPQAQYAVRARKAAPKSSTKKSGGKGKGKRTTKRAAAAPKQTPAWLLERGANSAKRKALAVELREAGVDINEIVEVGGVEMTRWQAEKNARGIK
jgi:hypothetical protein